jgi:hypothetical protein
VVAETHSAYDDLSKSDVVDFVLNVVAGLDLDASAGVSTTLADCDVRSSADVAELADLVSEEYGERTLLGIDLEDVEQTCSVADFVSLLYPDLSDDAGDG